MENKIAQFIFEKSGIPKFRKFLDLSSLRHKLVSGNLANTSTPGYKAKDLDFHTEFKKMTQDTERISGSMTHRNHIPLGNSPTKGPKVTEEKVEIDELNSIDIDNEISNLAQNELIFSVGATLLQRRFEGIRTAIKSR